MMNEVKCRYGFMFLKLDLEGFAAAGLGDAPYLRGENYQERS
jgi:hypothetical protein